MSAEALRFGSALYRAHSVLQQCLDERLGDWHGLSLGDFYLLQALDEQPGLALQALAGALIRTSRRASGIATSSATGGCA